MLDRIQQLIDAEVGPEQYWWLSFVGRDLPPGRRFLGVAVVRARGGISAVRASHVNRCNPGGEVAYRLAEHQTLPPEQWLNRLVTAKEEVHRLYDLWSQAATS